VVPAMRNVHLLLGLFALPFLVMYGVSAVQMAHSGWFEMKPAVTQSAGRLPPGETDARRLVRALPVFGELQQINPTDNGIRFRLFRPGAIQEIEYNRRTGAAVITTRRAPAIGMLNRLHHSAGFWHELPALKLWAAAVALVSLALLGLGGTGLWLWFQRRKERRVGALLLATNLFFALTVLMLLRLS